MGFTKSFKIISLSDVYAMYGSCFTRDFLNEDTGENDEKCEDDKADDNEL